MTKMNHQRKNLSDKARRPTTESLSTSSWMKMKSKYNSTCSICKQNIKEQSPIYWNKSSKQVVHAGCHAYGKKQGAHAMKKEKPKLDKKGKNVFIAPAHTRGWRDIV